MIEHTSTSEVRSYAFYDAVDQFVEKYALDVRPRTREMVRNGGLRIEKTHDPSHDQNHYLHMLQDTEWILTMYPDLRDRIGWNTYLCALSFHDDAVSSLKPNPVNLYLAQNAETHIASRPATRYMRLHGFPEQEVKNVSDLIRLHPLDLTNSKRIAWEQTTDEKLRLTGRLLYVVDSLDVFRPSRIDAMIVYVQRSLWNLSPVMIKDQLLRYYTKNTEFALDLGPAYPGIQEEAARRRQEALDYIAELVSSRRDVRGFRS